MNKKQQIKTLVNGEESSSIAVTDRGLQFGDGVFETIRIHQGRPVWWQQHIDRLLDGCSRLQFSRLPDVDILRQEVNELLTGTETGSLKIIITRGNSSCGYAAAADSIPNRVIIFTPGIRHQSRTEQGIVLGVCEQTISGSQQLSGIKHLNRLEQVLARLECQDNDWDEGLMLDDKSRVIEGCMSNLFVWQKDKLMTPQLEHTGIRGICRERVILLAKAEGLEVEQCELDLGDLLHSDGLFVSNSLIGIWPVVSFKCPQIQERQFEINA
ncbi:MAG: aminodeoxychorismate lyase, partial [Gammaproteobacteria bacterium]|nr:aminodeoxychorismate lyase [Gammaproteobacteria bacterium]